MTHYISKGIFPNIGLVKLCLHSHHHDVTHELVVINVTLKYYFHDFKNLSTKYQKTSKIFMSKRKNSEVQKTTAILKFKSSLSQIEIDQTWTLEEFREKVSDYLKISEEKKLKLTCQKHLLPKRKNFRRLRSLSEINFEEEILFQAFEKQQKIPNFYLQEIEEDFISSFHLNKKRKRL